MNAILSTTPTKPYWLVLTAFLIMEATATFENVMIFMAIPTLMNDLELGVQTVSWAITIYLLVGSGTVLLAGRLGDLLGHRKVMLTVLVLATVGPIISGVMGNMEGILIGRAFQGTSVAIFPLLVAIARGVVPEKRVPTLVSVTVGAAPLFGALGMYVAGLILQATHWTALFYASSALAALALIAGIVIIPRAEAKAVSARSHIDYVGALLPLPALAGILYGINGMGSGDRALSIALIAVGVLVMVFWVLFELRISNPMFNLRLFTKRALILVLAGSALISVGLLGPLQLVNSLLLQSSADGPVGIGLSPSDAGLVGLLTGIFGFAAAPLAGKISALTGARNSLLIGMACAAVAIVTFLFAGNSLALAIVAVTVVGIASTFILSGLPNIVVEVVPPENTGEAVSMVFGTSRALFTAVGTVIGGMLLSISVVPETNAPDMWSWTATCLWMLVGTVLAAVTVAFIRSKKRAARQEMADASL